MTAIFTNITWIKLIFYYILMLHSGMINDTSFRIFTINQNFFIIIFHNNGWNLDVYQTNVTRGDDRQKLGNLEKDMKGIVSQSWIELNCCPDFK